jgi:hypothetical protein
MRERRHGVVCVLVALACLAAGIALAQDKAPFSERWQTVPPKTPPAQPAPPAAQSLPVPLDQALYLIRSALLTLNDANRSGNYSVLRDLAAPDFQARNTAADLAAIFANLRQRHIDLHAAAMIAPQLAAAPALDDKGMLRLTGLFPTQPQQIKFDLLFQNVGGEWRLFGISIATPDAVPPAPAQAPAGPPPGQARALPR